MTEFTAGPSVRPRPPQRRWWLFIPRMAWSPMVYAGIFATAASYPLYADDSLWIGVAIFVTTLVGLHLLRATHQLPWLPGFVALVAALQSVFAPWAAYHLPLAPDAIPMAVEPDVYFGFAVPALLALIAGMYWPLIRQGRRAPSGRNETPVEPTAQLARNFDRMLIAGIAIQILVVPLAPPSLLFAVTLL